MCFLREGHFLLEFVVNTQLICLKTKIDRCCFVWKILTVEIIYCGYRESSNDYDVRNVRHVDWWKSCDCATDAELLMLVMLVCSAGIMTDSRVSAVARQTGLSEAHAANLLRGQHCSIFTYLLLYVIYHRTCCQLSLSHVYRGWKKIFGIFSAMASYFIMKFDAFVNASQTNITVWNCMKFTSPVVQWTCDFFHFQNVLVSKSTVNIIQMTSLLKISALDFQFTQLKPTGLPCLG